jgi:hypothetical protein
LCAVLTAALLLAVAPVARAQSTAVNGTIEGNIVDASGGVMPGVTVTITAAVRRAPRFRPPAGEPHGPVAEVVCPAPGPAWSNMTAMQRQRQTARLGGPPWSKPPNICS